MSESFQREVLQRLTQLEILQRVNTVIISKFIRQLDSTRRELHLPKLVSFWTFDLTDDEYDELISEYDPKDVNKALYYLARQLAENKMDCPNNIKRYIIKQLKRQATNRKYYNARKKEEKSE